MSKLKQTKIPVTLGLDGILRVAEEQGIIETEFNWKLVRERDGLTKQSKGIKWLEFNDDGTFKEQFKEVSIGRSLLMSPFNRSFTWQCTSLTEIMEERDSYIKFKTLNSVYELFKL
jgi:hypothetical protein